MNTGYHSSVESPSAIPVPTKTWTTLYTFTDLPKGPTILHGQLYATLPNPYPRNILARLLRVETNDPTARTHLTVGLMGSWSATYTAMMFIDDERTLALQLYQDSTAPLVITTNIEKALNPGEYIAQRIKVAVE
jgi:hypothetical protein